MEKSDKGDGGVPRSVDQLQRALEDGQCFRWEYYERRMYFEFVETVGPVVTETDPYEDDPFTTAASTNKLQTVLRFGGVEPIDCDEIPGKGAKA